MMSCVSCPRKRIAHMITPVKNGRHIVLAMCAAKPSRASWNIQILTITVSAQRNAIAGPMNPKDGMRRNKRRRRRPDPTQVLARSEEHTSELQSRFDLVCRLLLEKKKE